MNLSIIVPVRDRDKELNTLIYNLSKIFKTQGITYTFYIVHQDDDNPFNKGLLNNIGFLYAEKNNFTDNYLFNDVTVYPLKSNNYNFNFKYENNIIYNPFGYKHCLSRFFLTNKKTMYKINGYSNEYWGWGYEDEDIQKRCKLHNVIINRNIFTHRSHNKHPKKFFDIKSNHTRNWKLAQKTTKKIFKTKWKKKKNILHNLTNEGLSSIDLNKYIKKTIINNNIINIYIETKCFTSPAINDDTNDFRPYIVTY